MVRWVKFRNSFRGCILVAHGVDHKDVVHFDIRSYLMWGVKLDKNWIIHVFELFFLPQYLSKSLSFGNSNIQGKPHNYRIYRNYGMIMGLIHLFTNWKSTISLVLFGFLDWLYCYLIEYVEKLWKLLNDEMQKTKRSYNNDFNGICEKF